jgi:hypothetical protein
VPEHRAPRTPQAGSRGVRANPSTSRLRSKAEIDLANAQIVMAIALGGMAQGDELVCPKCGPEKCRGKVKLVAEKNYFGCYHCWWFPEAIELLTVSLGLDAKRDFLKVVDMLLGADSKAHPNETPQERQTRIDEIAARVSAMATKAFNAEMSADTVAVYNAVLASEFVSLEQAQRYYATWHISAEAVATIGFVVITDVKGLINSLVKTYGRDLMLRSGLARALEEDERDEFGHRLRFMFSANYPVVEPQIGPSGNCMSMQFRPSMRQKAKIAAHKAGKGDYVPQFMSLRGATSEHLIGVGLDYLVKLVPGSDGKPITVDVVEGAKDVAADLTLGHPAFGMPGTKVLPPARSVRALAKAGHNIRICMDGDEAGQASQQKVYEHFVANGFPADKISIHTMPIGLDIADALVRKFARSGDMCDTCQAWRTNHPG